MGFRRGKKHRFTFTGETRHLSLGWLTLGCRLVLRLLRGRLQLGI